MANKTDTGQDRKDSIHGGTMKDKKRKKFYKEMKKLYALPDMRTEEEKESDFANELW